MLIACYVTHLPQYTANHEDQALYSNNATLCIPQNLVTARTYTGQILIGHSLVSSCSSCDLRDLAASLQSADEGDKGRWSKHKHNYKRMFVKHVVLHLHIPVAKAQVILLRHVLFIFMLGQKACNSHVFRLMIVTGNYANQLATL